MVQSAYEDLQRRTLARISGVWGKLTYLAGQRSADGFYRHWGFERAHGTAAAQITFARAHQSLLGEILRAKLRELREDLAQTSAAEETSPISYVSKLTASPSWLMPPDCLKAAELHLTSVLKTLSILENRSQRGSRAS